MRDLVSGVGGTHFNVLFYPSAGAAQSGGFRACKRCRPDATPGSPEWNGRADLVGRAMRLIADGVVDREGVAGIAERWRPWRAYAVQHLWAAQDQMPMIERPATRKEVVA